MNTASAGLDRQTFAIGILCITACVLFVGLLLVSQQPVLAMGMNDRGGDYIMCTQQIAANSEAVVVIDGAAKQMILCQLDFNTRRIELILPQPVPARPDAEAAACGPRVAHAPALSISINPVRRAVARLYSVPAEQRDKRVNVVKN